jgi:hypothetical protein
MPDFSLSPGLVIASRTRTVGVAMSTCGRISSIWPEKVPALVLHHAAAGTFFGVHFRTGNHAGHRRSQARHQQQDQHIELVENTHHCD